MTTVETDGGFVRVTGTEADLCRLIAHRQKIGLKKYGVQLRDNPLSLKQWLLHALEESLDHSAYLMRALEEIHKQEDDGK